MGIICYFPILLCYCPSSSPTQFIYITICCQMRPLLPLAHHRLRPPEPLYVLKTECGFSKAMGIQVREYMPPHLYFVLCSNTENYSDTALKVKPSILFAILHFLITFAIYLGILSLLQIRPFPSYDTCVH